MIALMNLWNDYDDNSEDYRTTSDFNNSDLGKDHLANKEINVMLYMVL